MDVVIIGSSAASKSAVSTLLRNKKVDIKVNVITRDTKPYYSRVLLPNFIAGEIDETGLQFVDRNFFMDERLNIIHGNAIKIDGSSKKVFIEGYGWKKYDKLLITTGARPVMPYENNVKGLCCLRDFEDALEIKDLARDSQNCIVIGGGLVSLKAAWALNELGKNVTVLVASNRVLSRTVDAFCSLMVAEILKKNGINIMLSTKIREFKTNGERIEGVILEDGTTCSCDLAVVGKGVKPNINLAQNSGIKVDRGILVDNNMSTSMKDVYAAGDVAQAYSFLGGDSDLFTLWPDAVEQGKVAASNILGISRRYQGGITMNSVKFYDVPFISIGNIGENMLSNCLTYINKDDKKKTYRKIVVRDKKIVGAVFAGDVSYAGMVYWDIKSKRQIEKPEKYLTRKGLEKIYLLHNKQL